MGTTEVRGETPKRRSRGETPEEEREERRLEEEKEEKRRQLEEEREEKRRRLEEERRQEEEEKEERRRKKDEDRETRREERELRKLEMEVELMRQREAAKKEHQLEPARLAAANGGGRTAERDDRAKAPKLPSFVDGKDDLDTYLPMLERFADVAKWHKTEWASKLSALLSGRALEMYSRLSEEAARGYDRVKLR